jgi:tetratricopeptide (TPR) repeat protein
VLLVCSSRLEGVEEEVVLAPLDPAHAVEMLRADAKAAGVADAVEEATPAELERLVESAGRLPFVLRWAVAYLRDSRAQVREVADLLAREPGEPRVSYCMRISLDRLDPQQRLLFLAFSLYPQPTTAEAAAAAAGVGPAHSALLERLVRLRLVRKADAPQRYRPILRADRLGYLMLEADPSFRDAATQRAVDFVLGAVRQGPERLEGEIGNVLWATLQAFEAGRWDAVVEMRRLLSDFLYNHGRYNEALLLGDRAFDAADRLPDHDQRAWCALYPLAQVHRAQGNLDEAWRWAGRALALFAQQGNAYGQAMACLDLGWVLRDHGQPGRAETVLRRGAGYAAEQVRRYGAEIDHVRLQARLQAALAVLARDGGRLAEAVELYRDARTLYLAGDDEGGSASVMSQLAALALDLGNEAEAERLLDEGLRELKDPHRREVRSARFWVLQALLAERRGDLAGAQALLLDARRVLRDEPAEVPRITAALARITASASSEQPDSSL